MHPLAPSPPAVDDLAAPRLVLRDGIGRERPPLARPSDREAMRRFFHELSPESRRQRFFTAGEPPDALIDRLCDSADRARSVTLVAVRRSTATTRLIAVGSYFATGAGVAEVAFAVDDRFHGKGLGDDAARAAGGDRRRRTASRASRRRRWPTTARCSRCFATPGFEVRSKIGDAARRRAAVADAVGRRRRGGRARATARRPPRRCGRCSSRGRSRSIGASRDPASIGGRILDALVAAGFSGPVYPINPQRRRDRTACRAIASARDAAAPASIWRSSRCRATAVLGVVDDCAAAGVKSLVVITAGFAEVGDDGRALQQQLVEQVRGYGMRMVGPNCMGLLNASPASG